MRATIFQPENFWSDYLKVKPILVIQILLRLNKL